MTYTLVESSKIVRVDTCWGSVGQREGRYGSKRKNWEAQTRTCVATNASNAYL